MSSLSFTSIALAIVLARGVDHTRVEVEDHRYLLGACREQALQIQRGVGLNVREMSEADILNEYYSLH